MGRGSSSFCRSGSRTRRDQLERFKRKPAPDLIRGGNRFAPRKRVKSRIQSPASIPSKRGSADPQSINRTSDGMAWASHAGVHASLNYAAAAVALVRKAGGVRVIAIAIPIGVIAVPISIRIIVSVVVIVVIRVAEAESEAAAPEVAVMESAATKLTESATTKFTTTESASHPATMESAEAAAMETAEAATMESATAHAASVETAPAATEAATAAVAATTTTASASASQRH